MHASSLVHPELHLEHDRHRHGLAVERGGRKHPFASGGDGLLVQAMGRVERPGNLGVPDGPISPHHDAQLHDPFDLGAQAFRCVLRMGLAHQPRRHHSWRVDFIRLLSGLVVCARRHDRISHRRPHFAV